MMRLRHLEILSHCCRTFSSASKKTPEATEKAVAAAATAGQVKPPTPAAAPAKDKTAASVNPVPPEILAVLEEGYKCLAESDSKSLLKKHLTKPIFDKLKTQMTPTFESTLLDCVRSGYCNLDSNVGIYAPDAEAYKTFADIFDPIIEDYHKGFQRSAKHPETCFGYGTDFPNLDPDNLYVVSTRVRCGRSLKNYPFNPCLTEDEYGELECAINKALGTLSGIYAGTYMPLEGMDKAEQQQLIDDHLFKEGDRFLAAAGATNFWPSGRGIFINEAKNFMVWVNEEDHLRIISMEKGGDLGQVYERLIVGVETLGKQLEFARDSRLGYLTFCPTNLGTTLRASVHIKLPALMQDPNLMQKLIDKHNLQVRGTSGEHSEAKDNVLDISNKRRLGLTEYEAIKEMYEGIRALIDAECARCGQ